MTMRRDADTPVGYAWVNAGGSFGIIVRKVTNYYAAGRRMARIARFEKGDEDIGCNEHA